MTFKITVQEKDFTINNRIAGALTEISIENGIEWLYSWCGMSFNMDKKFKTLKFANKILSPIKKLSPYVPKRIPKVLYRVIGTDKKVQSNNLKLPPNQLYSCTPLGKKYWNDLADQIGAFDSEFVYVIEIDQTNIAYLFDIEWVLNKVVPATKEFHRSTGLRSTAEDFRWQKEIVIYSTVPINARVKTELYHTY